MAVVDWLRDNLVQLLNRQLSSDESSQRLEKDDRRNSSRFVRWWIHSHHIVGKAKRQTLPVLADQYDLTGFLLPGKPGVICVEGAEEDVKEFWERIRTWAWKKIGVRHMEDCSTSNSARKFGKLREQSQMDMTAFKRFLDDHNCVEVFPVLFGLSDLIDG